MTEMKMEFTGWVEKILPQGQYGQEFVVRDYKDEKDAPKYPTALKFEAGTAAIPQLQGVLEGDKVRVLFYVCGRSGIGKNGYYCINRLRIAKEGGLVVIERTGVPPPQEIPDSSSAEDDIPF